MSISIIIRPATKRDSQGITDLLNSNNFINRHLDWRSSVDWLGHKSFWVIEHKKRIISALAIIADLPGVAWVRLFAIASHVNPGDIWRLLFEKTVDDYISNPNTTIAALGMHNWFVDILETSDFIHHQDIVILKWENNSITSPHLSTNLVFKKMTPLDLENVLYIDQISFEPLWQFSMDSLFLAFKQSAYATVAISSNQIVGYQISTLSNDIAHLARIAVKPEFQRHNIGYSLVQDMLIHFINNNIHTITVNTQHDNQGSLSLYGKFGFNLTGEIFPVYTYSSK